MAQSRNGTSAMSLPSGFVTVRDIVDGKVQPRTKVSIFGIVTDFRVPIPTRGTDWKCEIRLYDSSIEDDSESLLFSIFRPQDQMPIANLGDVILIVSATVQQREGLSLMTSFGTKIHVYDASKIPGPPTDASCALRPPPKNQTARPGDKENAYVSHLFRRVDKSRLPDQSEFELMKIQSANVKDKFMELKDAREGKFCDIIAQVVKEPYDLGDKMTLWVSDYTENASFFHHSFGGRGLSEGRDGDPYGYTNKFVKETSSDSDWKGPFGKRSVQITVWEPHATFVRECPVTLNSWVLIKNLHIKFGHNAANLEGALREDRGAHGIKINISQLDPQHDPEHMNPRLKAAIRRKRDYERARKEQLKTITEAAKAGAKRKAALAGESEPKPNSKARRKKLRKQAMKEASRETSKEGSKETPPSSTVDVNPSVRCEHTMKRTSTVAEMLQPTLHETTYNDHTIKIPLPFANLNYRANVRVVDFLPPNLADFAVPRKASSEFDVLSDNEEDSDPGSDSDTEPDTTQDSEPELGWQWRFYLKLEDASLPRGQEKQQVWVGVDNQAAQLLLDLDASNLKCNPEDLEVLRQKLFILWGELEEHNSLKENKRTKSVQAARRGEAPMHSSDDEEESSSRSPEKKVCSRPFSCCIRQYGIKVSESDPLKADASKGKRWQRMFALFGTRIVES